MPTTASSNHPHVRITPEDHENIRALSILTGRSQGEWVGILVEEELAKMGNPHKSLKFPPRQRTGRKNSAEKATPLRQMGKKSKGQPAKRVSRAHGS